MFPRGQYRERLFQINENIRKYKNECPNVSKIGLNEMNLTYALTSSTRIRIITHKHNRASVHEHLQSEHRQEERRKKLQKIQPH